MSEQYDIVDCKDTDLWDRFVDSHSRGTIFHTRAMVNVFAASEGHTPLAIAACNQAGNILAILVAVEVQTLSGFAKRFASRSIYYAEPLCQDDDEGICALVSLIRHHDRTMRSTLFSEVRPIGSHGAERVALEKCDYEYKDYLNYVVDLTRSVEELWKGLGKSCRQKIRRSTRRGVVVSENISDESLDQLYLNLQTSYGRSQVPLADKSLFKAAVNILPHNAVHIRTAYWKDRPVASGISLLYKDRFYAWYGGSERLAQVTPFDCLTWEEIKWASENGMGLYDFGGAGWPDEYYGPREFKAKFGGTLEHFGRYRKIQSKWKMRLARSAYDMSRHILSPSAKK